jgi:integrase
MKSINNNTLDNYTVPVIRTANPNDWFIYFEFFHGGEWHGRKIRKGINRFELKERKKEAEGLRDATELKLKLGWNPVIDPEFKARNVLKGEDLGQMNFNDAMDFALEKKRKELAKKSFVDYRNILTIVKEYATKTGFGFMPVREMKRLHIITLLEGLSEERAFSNHRFNMYLGCICSMFTTLETWTVCDYNPATKIPKRVVAESNKFAAFTEEEKGRISEHLAAKHHQLFVFVQFVYQMGIRPKELLLLKVGQIDLKRRVVTLVPDLKEETTKTKFVQQKPIPNVLWSFVSQMYLQQYDPEFYVFGSPFEPGKGNRGFITAMVPGQRRMIKQTRRNGFEVSERVTGAMRPDYLKPSPFKASRDTVTRLWQTLVKEELNINKCLYAAKHTGADDKILAGIDLDALRNMYGHRSKQMSERYATEIRQLHNSKIIEQSPDFAAKKKPAKVRRIA